MTQIKVATFNMQFGQVWDAKAPDQAPIDIPRSIGVIKKEKADIILLQEVEQCKPGLGNASIPENYNLLKASMEDYDSYFSYPAYSEDELPFGYGLAIFCRNPLFKKTKIDLPASPLKFKFQNKEHKLTKRLLIGASSIFKGKKIQIFNTHLQSFFILNKSSDTYPAQREKVIRSIAQSKTPVIFGGDLNSAPGESTIKFFESKGYQTAQQKKTTWKRYPFTLDHIFYSKEFSLEKCIVRRTRASDHNIVSAILRL